MRDKNKVFSFFQLAGSVLIAAFYVFGLKLWPSLAENYFYLRSMSTAWMLLMVLWASDVVPYSLVWDYKLFTIIVFFIISGIATVILLIKLFNNYTVINGSQLNGIINNLIGIILSFVLIVSSNSFFEKIKNKKNLNYLYVIIIPYIMFVFSRLMFSFFCIFLLQHFISFFKILIIK